MCSRKFTRTCCLLLLIVLDPQRTHAASCDEVYAQLMLNEHSHSELPFGASAEAPVAKKGKWVPGNSKAEVRHKGMPLAAEHPVDVPAFVSGPFVKHGKILGPNGDIKALYNPTAFVGRKNGKEKVFIVARAEKELPEDSPWARLSLPKLYESDDGLHFTLSQEKPLFEPSLPSDLLGGIEDPRIARFDLQPVIHEGKSFDSAILFTAYDGKTARISTTLFNRNDLGGEFRKIGPLFDDADMIKNPLVPGNPAWNKSAAAIQYADPKTGKIRNILYAGEGAADHGGIMAMESDTPLGWKWPAHQKPSITTRPGEYDHGLVEAAFEPVIGPLPPELAKATGQTHGIYVTLHGDAPPKGYQVGYRIFSLENPTGKPIYASKGPFLSPTEPWEINGQVEKVVFASGSVEFKGRRFIYYGAADSYIGAASAPIAK
ncbi:MAG: hypothetical protein ABIR96_11420, partial [Bdellovibrionota bacterium]